MGSGGSGRSGRSGRYIGEEGLREREMISELGESLCKLVFRSWKSGGWSWELDLEFGVGVAVGEGAGVGVEFGGGVGRGGE
jgi:hypothetical protein